MWNKKNKIIYLLLLQFIGAANLSAQDITEYLTKGNKMIDLKKPKEAIIYYDSLIAIDKNYKDAYFNRARAKYLSGNYLDAIEDLHTLLAMDSLDYEAFFYRGFIKAQYKYEKDISSTFDPIADYNKSLSINPDYGLAYSYRGLHKMKEGRFDEALIDCNVGVNKLPDNQFCYFNRGKVKDMLKDYKGAIDDYKKVIELDSTYYPALLNSIDNRKLIKDYSGAIHDLDLLLKIFPDKPKIYLRRGEVKLLAKDAKGACEDFEKAKQLGCDDEQSTVEKLIKKNCKKKKK